jgi:hypothetical protein
MIAGGSATIRKPFLHSFRNQEGKQMISRNFRRALSFVTERGTDHEIITDCSQVRIVLHGI